MDPYSAVPQSSTLAIPDPGQIGSQTEHWRFVLPSVLAIGNFFLAANVLPRVFAVPISYGWYVAQYIVLAAWLVWGAGGTLPRSIAAMRLGGAWLAAYWLGDAARVWSLGFTWRLNESMAQSFTVLPLALSVSAAPLMLVRRSFRLHYIRPSVSVHSSPIYDYATLGVLFVGVAVGLRYKGYGTTEFLMTLYIGVMLGIVAFVTSMTLAYAVLDHSIKAWMVAHAIASVSGIGLFLGSMFSAPGPGAAGTVNGAWEGCFGAMLSTILVLTYFLSWRIQGLRVNATK